MNGLAIFENSEFGKIRTIEENGNVLFCGSDVANALGYAIPTKAVNTHCKGVSKMEAPTAGGTQKLLFITEGDVYRLIVHSKLPSAERFERWVFDEVLPSIRKHGMYATDELLNNPDFAIQVFQELKAEREQRKQMEAKVIEQKRLVAELKPKADYTDKILQCKGLVAVTQIAKDYGMSGQAFNAKLHELGIQYNMRGQWLLYAKYQDCGYVHSSTWVNSKSSGGNDVYMHTKWTQKGRLFLYNKLKEAGILPLIEQPA